MAGTTTNRALTQYVADTTSDLFIRDVPDWTVKQRRTDTPFLNAIGRAGAPSRPMLKAEWGWGSPDPVSDSLSVAITLTGATTISVTNSAYFQVGDVILVGDEQMRVIGTGSGTLDVVRGFAGTTAATALISAPVYMLGVAMTENADDPISPVTQGEVDYNYHSLFQFGWQFSDRAKVTPTYETLGQSGDRFTIELRKKMKDTAPVRLERQLLFGQRALGSTSTASAMGGLAQSSFVTTRSSLSSNPLTEYDLLENLNTVWNLVGGDMIGKTIHTSMFTKRVINSWYNDTRRSNTSDSKMSLTWDTIETDLGTFSIDVNYQFDSMTGQKDNLYLLNYDDFELRPYASSTGWQTGKRATDGPYSFGFLRGDFTLIAQNPDSRLQLHTYSTTSTDYPGFA